MIWNIILLVKEGFPEIEAKRSPTKWDAFFHFRVLSLQYFPVFYKEEKCEAVVHRAKCNDVINTITTAPILLAIIVVILIYSRHSLSMTTNIVNNEWFDVIRASFSTCTQQQRDKLENNFNSGLTPVDNG